jgi:putative transcriptional regulator
MPIVKTSKADAEKYLKDFDWSAADAMTDDNITRQIAENPDVAPELNEAWFQRAEKVEGIGRGRPTSKMRDAVANRPAAAGVVDVAAIRNRLKMTQEDFARAFRFSPAAVRALEQGRRKPSGPVQAFLELIADDPNYIQERLARRIAHRLKTAPAPVAEKRSRSSSKRP